jgi:hypothetical protein
MIRRYSWPYWFFVLEKPVFSTRTQGSDSIPLSEYWLERYICSLCMRYLKIIPSNAGVKQIALIRDIGIGSPY